MAHFTTTDGVRIYYESHGSGDPLFLAYGIGGNAGMWQPNIHALAHPERLRALVVVDSSSAVGLPLSVENVVMRARSIEVTLKGGMDAMAEFAIASNPNVAGRLKLDPGARQEILDYYRMLTPIGYANALRALLQMDYITERLPEISAPTLLVCGDEDPSLAPMRVMEKKIKQARFVLLSPAGHFANRDQPGAFNRAVLEFLDEIGPA